ncbi:aldo/keto reductase [Gryllotalpicola protaetiae]|uniref:Aldo/keto reductase n=1 Tax=Gryllotalpicola protaetiae TaxID=2419771 RepID=A0A387BMI9_9MICO|nr:aldo/keto reductase [Gryllotalpicola protaetiae]AYG02419.1 aldo/keto reductase [Gryllotalpicola protaetiae]
MTELNDYVTLGRSGLHLSPATLGTMTFGEDNGWGASVEASVAMLDRYVDAGGNSIDTANIYTNGHSEAIVGDWLSARGALRDRLVVGTKFFANLHTGDPNGGGASRKAILHQLEDSLRRLRTDYVDVYWLHNFDAVTPREETLRALDDLVTAGKVRYLGFSDVPAWSTAAAALTASFRGWAPIVGLQLEYSLLERTGEAELLPMADDLGLGALAWGPLKSGWLSGKFSSARVGEHVDTARGELVGAPSSADYPVIDALNSVAAELGAPAATVALAWVRGSAGITSTLLGARTMHQLEANLASLRFELPADARRALDEASAPHLPFPIENNRHLAPMLQFNGASVNGVAHARFPMLEQSATRY